MKTACLCLLAALSFAACGPGGSNTPNAPANAQEGGPTMSAARADAEVADACAAMVDEYRAGLDRITDESVQRMLQPEDGGRPLMSKAEADEYREENERDDRRMVDGLKAKLDKLIAEHRIELRELAQRNAGQPRTERIRILRVRLSELLKK